MSQFVGSFVSMKMSTLNQGEQSSPREVLPADDRQAGAHPAEHPRQFGPARLLASAGSNNPTVRQPLPESQSMSTAAAVFSALKEILQIVLPAIFLAALIHLFLAQATIVRGQSMQPNLRPEERLIMEKLSYYFQAPRHNEIIVLDMPGSPALIIKRVVGLPGETVEIRQGRILVDGREMAYTKAIQPGLAALPAGEVSQPDPGSREFLADYGPVTLAEDLFFVLGDNSHNSNDSRTFGPVHRDYVKGRIWVRYWPLTRFTIFR
ncbi:MAG: signal peptidase I [Caldilineaceae bacterium]|nr:signal peptidase I [Caldilineaceae bacterium]